MSKPKKTTIAIAPESRDRLQVIKYYYEDHDGKFVDMDEVIRKILEYVPQAIKTYKS